MEEFNNENLDEQLKANNQNDENSNDMPSYNQQSEILSKGKTLVKSPYSVQKPPFLISRGQGMNIGPGSGGFVPMITVAGILVLMGIIVAYIIFGV